MYDHMNIFGFSCHDVFQNTMTWVMTSYSDFNFLKYYLNISQHYVHNFWYSLALFCADYFTECIKCFSTGIAVVQKCCLFLGSGRKNNEILDKVIIHNLAMATLQRGYQRSFMIFAAISIITSILCDKSFGKHFHYCIHSEKQITVWAYLNML